MNVYNDRMSIKLLIAILLSIVFMIIFSVVFAPIGLMFFIISVLHFRFLKLKYGSRISCPNGQDILYGMDKTKSDCNCNLLVTFDGQMTFLKFKETIWKKFQLNNYPIYQRRLRRYQQLYKKILGYNYFIDDISFNINNHFTEVKKEDLFNDPKLLANPDKIQSFAGDEHVTENWQKLTDRMMKKYGNVVLDKNKPLWHIYFYRDENSYSVMIRYSHVIVDGVHFLRFFLEEFGDKPIIQPLPFTFQHRHPIIRYALMLGIYLLLPLGFDKIFRHPGNNPLHGKPLTGNKTRVVSLPIPLNEIKEVKRSAKTNFNAILFSCFAYAMRCHYRAKEGKTRKTYVVIPVSLQDLRKEIETKNSHGLMSIMLTTETRDPENDTALRRLKIIEKDMYNSVNDKSFLPIQLAVRMLCPLLPIFMNKRLLRAKGLTAAMSNIPGPAKESIQIGDTYSRDMIFWIPDRDPMGMGVTYLGNLGTVRVGLQADWALMKTNKEAYDFLANFRQELCNLRNELGFSPTTQGQTEIYQIS